MWQRVPCLAALPAGPRARAACAALALTIPMLMLMTAHPGAANPPPEHAGPEHARPEYARGRVLVIRDDMGGMIQARVQQIHRLRAAGTRVEIRGRRCLSTCTMFLGLSDSCVVPTTVFGFHGPSFYGHPMHPREFEHWSRIMARHYPPPLRTWFMATARRRIVGFHELRGSDLIRMGIARC